MTTKGKALRRRDAFLLPIGLDGSDRPLWELPDLIAEVEALNDGRPLEVEMPPDLQPANRRLLETLGVRIRYSPPG